MLVRLALAGAALLVVLRAGPLQAAESTAGAVVTEQIHGEEAECRFLLNLCWAANVRREHAESTPRAADTLLFRQAGEASLADLDARDAARAIRKKHGGRKLWCFDDPECAFLKEKR